MTLDTQLRSRLASAVDDTTVPSDLAGAALVGGRRRRRRRTTVALALASVAVVGGAVLVPSLGDPATRSDVAGGGGRLADPTAFRWAGTLPRGTQPAIPYFAYARLWSGEQSIALPASVNPSVGPWAVDGGWVVLTGKAEADLGWAMLSPDGSLHALPPETYRSGLGAVRMEVSPDGRQVATGRWLVDLATMTATELPHSPARQQSDGFVTDVEPHGFTEQGLVYDAAPYVEGLGTTWLLRPDGTTTRVALPEGAQVRDGSPGDAAVGFADGSGSDTCVTVHRLRDARWVEDGSGCMGERIGEALPVSPDGRWLLTDDLPRVWDLHLGEFATVDVPRDVVASRGDDLVGGIVWETGDAFLLPIPDRTSEGMVGPVDFDQFVRVVRCRLSTGQCELAADVENRVVVDGMASTAFRFPTG